MNKYDLVTTVAEKTGMTKKDSEKVVDAMTCTIAEALAGGDKVRLLGFGTFEVRERAARMGCNPKTGEQVSIPSSKTPVFKVSGMLKESVNKL